jgi:hypothetical protein
MLLRRFPRAISNPVGDSLEVGRVRLSCYKYAITKVGCPRL